MFIDMNPLEVDVGRKKRKADARYSLTSACFGALPILQNDSCNSPETLAVILSQVFLEFPDCLLFHAYGQ